MNPALGSLIRRLRERAEMSQEELAARAGVSRAMIQSAESGRHAPRRASLKRIASALGVDVRVLTGVPAVLPSDPSEERRLRETLAQLERDRDRFSTDFAVTYKVIAKALDAEIEEVHRQLRAFEEARGNDELRESGS